MLSADSIAHIAVIWSNLTALVPLRRCLRHKRKVTALLVSLSFLSSTVFHALNNDHGIRDVIPLSLKLDRFFAALLAFHIVSLPKTMTVFRNALSGAMPIAVPAVTAGGLSEMARGSKLYAPLHSVWHALIFVAADAFCVSCINN